MKKICIIAISFVLLNGADKNDRVKLSFAHKQSAAANKPYGYYDASILKKSQTLNSVLENTTSKDAISLDQVDKDGFDALYTIMILNPGEMAQSISSKNNMEIISLLEIADFLNIHEQIITALKIRLLDLITNRSSINIFILTPKSFLAKFDKISHLIDQQLQKNPVIQRSLITAVLKSAPFEKNNDKYPDISNIAISSKNHLAISYVNGIIEIFDLQIKKVIRRIMTDSNTLAINFSPDGNELFAACKNQTIYSWNVSSNEPLQSVESLMSYEKDDKYKTLLFSHDNKYLIWSPRDTAVRFIDSSNGSVAHTYKAQKPITAIGCSSNGYIAIATTETIDVVKISNFEMEYQIPLDHKAMIGNMVSTISFSPDNTKIAWGFASNRNIKVSDFEIENDKININKTATLSQKMESSRKTSTQSLDFSPNKLWLASHEYFGSSDIWDLSSQTILKKLNGKTQNDVALFSPSGDFLVASSAKLFKVWDITITKHALPLGILMLLYLFGDEKYIHQFDKEALKKAISSQLEQIINPDDRKIIGDYFMKKLK